MTSPSSASGAADEGFRSELQASLRRIDQSITAHSLLRDKFSRRAGTLSFAILAAAAVVTFLAISSEEIKSFFLLSHTNSDYLIGALGFIVLVCSIAELQFAWREKFARHAEAAGALARLKLVIGRDLGSEIAISRARYAEMQQAYENVNDLITRIPERKFLRLKAIHRRKVEMSKFLDDHPGSSITLLRVKIWFRDNLMSWPQGQ
jgi:hypothetical protein